MSEKTNSTSSSEIKAKGRLTKKSVEVAEKSAIDSLSSRGYGTTENDEFTLSFYEALYLKDKDLLEVRDERGKEVDFQESRWHTTRKANRKWMKLSRTCIQKA